jgi:hypothetical protein
MCIDLTFALGCTSPKENVVVVVMIITERKTTTT